VKPQIAGIYGYFNLFLQISKNSVRFDPSLQRKIMGALSPVQLLVLDACGARSKGAFTHRINVQVEPQMAEICRNPNMSTRDSRLKGKKYR
jgi:hypothetical protein